jgi:hypothetical protein
VNVHDAHRCLRFCLVLEPERERERRMNSGEWSSNCTVSYSEIGKERAVRTVTRTSDGPIITRDATH